MYYDKMCAFGRKYRNTRKFIHEYARDLRVIERVYVRQGDKGDKGDRGFTTTLKGEQFPSGVFEGPPGPPGPPGKHINEIICVREINDRTIQRVVCVLVRKAGVTVTSYRHFTQTCFARQFFSRTIRIMIL